MLLSQVNVASDQRNQLNDLSFTSGEMDKGFGVECYIQPASPVFEHCDDVLTENPIGLIVLLPSPRLDFKLTALLKTEGCVYESRFDLGGPKIDQFAMVRLTQKRIVEQLRVVFANEVEGRLEFIDARIGDDQIKIVRFCKITAGDRDRNLGSHWHICGLQAGGQIVLIDLFISQPS